MGFYGENHTCIVNDINWGGHITTVTRPLETMRTRLPPTKTMHNTHVNNSWWKMIGLKIKWNYTLIDNNNTITTIRRHSRNRTIVLFHSYTLTEFQLESNRFSTCEDGVTGHFLSNSNSTGLFYCDTIIAQTRREHGFTHRPQSWLRVLTGRKSVRMILNFCQCTCRDCY